MTENNDQLSARWEWVLERAAKDLGISVGELKRRLVPPKLRTSEVERARARGAAEWEIDAIKNCPTDLMRDIVRDQQNAPRSPSQAGASGQVGKVSTNPGLPGSNTGWQAPTPIRPPPGINYVDAQLDAQDRKDRHERMMEEAKRLAVMKAKGG